MKVGQWNAWTGVTFPGSLTGMVGSVAGGSMISGGLPGPGMGGITGGGISGGIWVPGSGVVAKVRGIMVFSNRSELVN